MTKDNSSGVRASSADPQLYRYSIGTLRADEAKRIVEVDGIPVDVDPRALRLLFSLLRHRNDVVSKEVFAAEVWPHLEVGKLDDGTIFKTVSRLRSQLGSAGDYVDTVIGSGYRMVGVSERTAVGTIPHHTLKFDVGATIPTRPDLKFVRELGGGRLRSVWLAETESGEPRVVKFAANGDELARLKREKSIYEFIQAAAPHSEQFPDFLSHNFLSSPYFIECSYGGEDLLVWNQQQRLSELGMGQRIALFLDIARAVETLHKLPAVHGDLKPANILLQEKAGLSHIRLTDLGSGRPLDKDQLDALGISQMSATVADALGGKNYGGTWMYLAPELHSGGRPEPASDIFALGVILYQILVADFGRPMTTGWEESIDQELLVEDIRAATHSQLKHRIESVSELIRRVSTVGDRAQQREHATRQAQVAHENAERLRRQEERRPKIIAAFVVLGVALSTSLWQYRNAVASAAEAKLEAKKAKALSDFLIRDVLEAADVTSVGPTKSLVVSDMLARASTQAGSRFSGLPESEGQVRMELGELYFRISDFVRTQAEYEAAAKLFGSGQAQIEATYSVARALLAQSKLDEADRLIAVAESQSAAAHSSDVPSVAFLAAKVKAQAFSMRQQYPVALTQASNAVRLADSAFPDDLIGRFLARKMLAEMQMRAGDLKAAGETLDQMNQAPFAPTSVGEVIFARAQVQRARLATLENRNEDAISYLIGARDAIARRLGPNEYTLGGIHEELGRAFLYRDRYSEASEEFSEAIRIFMLSVGPEHQQTMVNRLNLAVVHSSLGEPAKALATLDENRPWFVKNMGGPVVQLIDFFRARSMLDLGRTETVSETLTGLESEQLKVVSGTTYMDIAIQAELARLAVLQGRKQDMDKLRVLVAQMQKAGASEGEVQRYVRLYR